VHLGQLAGALLLIGGLVALCGSLVVTRPGRLMVSGWPLRRR
jgi:hypothetical protein